MSEFDVRLHRLAAAQHGVVRRDQALQLGFHPDQLSARARAGRLLRPAPSVFVVPGSPATLEQRALAAAWGVSGGVASGPTAAALWRLRGARDGPIEVTVQRGRHQPRPHVVRQADVLPASDTTVLGVVPVTRLERTIVDLARTWTADALGRALDDEVAAGRVRLDRLGRCALPLLGRGHPGSRTVTALLDERGPGFVPPDSELERALHVVLGTGAWGPVELQAPLPGALRGWVDARLPRHRVIVEADGRRWHTRVRDFALDRRRDREAGAAGWFVARFLHDELVHRPDEVRRILDAHAARTAAAGVSTSAASDPGP